MQSGNPFQGGAVRWYDLTYILTTSLSMLRIGWKKARKEAEGSGLQTIAIIQVTKQSDLDQKCSFENGLIFLMFIFQYTFKRKSQENCWYSECRVWEIRQERLLIFLAWVYRAIAFGMTMVGGVGISLHVWGKCCYCEFSYHNVVYSQTINFCTK